MGYVRSLQSKVCFLISRPPNSQFSNFSELLRCISEGWHCSTGERNVAMPREKTWQCQEPTETKIYSKPAQKKTSNIQICKLSGFNFFKRSIQRTLPGNQGIKGGTIHASQAAKFPGSSLQRNRDSGPDLVVEPPLPARKQPFNPSPPQGN